MRRVNPDTLEIEVDNEIEIIDNISKYVYILSEDGCWDYEETFHVKAFKDFNNALNEFHKKVIQCKKEMRSWVDHSDEIKEEMSVNKNDQNAYYSAWESNDSPRLNCEIRISKVEVE